MRKKIVGILICTLVITAVYLPITGSATLSYEHGLTCSNYGMLETQDLSAWSKKGSNLDEWGISEPIDLEGYHSASLIFFQQYNILPPSGEDTGYVKISDNGGSSWTTLKEVQGQVTEWEKNDLEITPWAGKTVLIGFEYKTGDSSISQGWYVDKIKIQAENDLPYTEDFEDYDIGDYWGDWVVTIRSSFNSPPIPPIINGPNNGNIDTLYEYSFRSFDPELDNISYFIYWGDGSTTDWTEPQSGDSASSYNEKHSWTEEGMFTITAKAKDYHEAQSELSEGFEVNIVIKSRNRQSTNLLFLQLFEKLLEQLHSSFPIVNKFIESIVTL